MEKNLTALKVLVIFIIGRVCCETVFVKTSADHTFTPKVTAKIEGILWKFKNDKVVEYDDGGEPRWYRFKGTLDTETGALTLQGLTKDGSGLYVADIQMAGKQELEAFKYEVTVIDPVPMPKVTCNVTNNEKTLQCSVDPPIQVDFEWNVLSNIKHGPTLHVHQDTDPESVYFCTAKNKVDRKSTQFALEDCNQGGGSSAGTIVGIVFAVVAGIFMSGGAAFVVYKKLKNSHEPVPKS